MTIKFPKEEENLSPEDAFTAYQHLVDYHLYFLRQQSKCEFFYWKGVGGFFILSIVLFVLENRGFILFPFIGVFLISMGVLLVFVQNMRTDFEFGREAAAIVERGLRIENRLDYPTKLFGIFEENKMIIYRGNLLSRLFPMGLISVIAAVAVTFLALEVSARLAFAVAIASITVLYLAAQSYVKTAMKILLGR